MGHIRWYKRDPDAALNGMMQLTLEERGAYNTILDLIYSRDGNLPDDDRFLAGWMRVDVRVWRRLRDRLVRLGKLYVEDGCLRNSRADVEVLSALSRVASAREAGLISAEIKAVKSSIKARRNKHIEPTDVGTGVATAVPTTNNHNQIEEGSVAKATGGEPPKTPSAIDLQTTIFATGKTILKAAGKTDREAGSILGRWRKDHGDPAVLNVLARCQVATPEDPVAWVIASLRAGERNGHSPRQRDDDHEFTDPLARVAAERSAARSADERRSSGGRPENRSRAPALLRSA